MHFFVLPSFLQLLLLFPSCLSFDYLFIHFFSSHPSFLRLSLVVPFPSFLLSFSYILHCYPYFFQQFFSFDSFGNFHCSLSFPLLFPSFHPSLFLITFVPSFAYLSLFPSHPSFYHLTIFHCYPSFLLLFFFDSFGNFHCYFHSLLSFPPSIIPSFFHHSLRSFLRLSSVDPFHSFHISFHCFSLFSSHPFFYPLAIFQCPLPVLPFFGYFSLFPSHLSFFPSAICL